MSVFRLLAILLVFSGCGNVALAADDSVETSLKAITADLDKWQVDKALAASKSLAKQCPKNSKVQATLGKALVFKCDYSHAVQPLRTAIQLDKNNPTAHWYLGAALAGLGKSAESKREYETALKLRPKLLKHHKGCSDCDWMKHVMGH